MIGSVERSAAIRGRLHGWRGVHCSRGLLGDDTARLEASLVDVVEADVGIGESWFGEDVAEEVLREDVLPAPTRVILVGTPRQ